MSRYLIDFIIGMMGGFLYTLFGGTYLKTILKGVIKEMSRGGKREGAGRPQKPENEKVIKYTFALYRDEIEKVKQFIKALRSNNWDLRNLFK